MRKILFLIVLFIPGMSFAQSLDMDAYKDFPAILQEITGAEMNQFVSLNSGQFKVLLDYAIEHKLSLFELLNLSAVIAVEDGVRFSIDGELFREFLPAHDFGGEKIEIIFPFEALEVISFGSDVGLFKNALDIKLDRKFKNDFYGFGTLYEERHFGFKYVTLNKFSNGFGMKAKKFFLNFPIDRIELYESEEAAFYMKGFPKPKKEVFWRIKKR